MHRSSKVKFAVWKWRSEIIIIMTDRMTRSRIANKTDKLTLREDIQQTNTRTELLTKLINFDQCIKSILKKSSRELKILVAVCDSV